MKGGSLMINTLFIIASVITVIGVIVVAVNFIAEKRKERSERIKSGRVAKNIQDYYKNSK